MSLFMQMPRTCIFRCPECGHFEVQEMSNNQAFMKYRSCPKCKKEVSSGLSTTGDTTAMIIADEQTDEHEKQKGTVEV